jgi:hypothetical protein
MAKNGRVERMLVTAFCQSSVKTAAFAQTTGKHRSQNGLRSGRIAPVIGCYTIDSCLRLLIKGYVPIRSKINLHSCPVPESLCLTPTP